jgi:hypothetical protein
MSQSENFEPANFTPETSDNSIDLPIQRDTESSTEANLASASCAGEMLAAAGEATAEVCADTLVGLVEKATNDPGAAFAPDVVACLIALKKNDRAAFEVLRAQLKEAGCRVTALDEAIAEASGELSERVMKQADILVGLAQQAELFHAPDGTSYADLDINGHRETWPLKSKGFRRWIARRYYEVEQGGTEFGRTSVSA